MTDIHPEGHAPKWYWWLPPNYSSFGDDVDKLYYWIFWITMVTFVLVEGALVWFCFKYRRNPARQAIYTHGNHKLEVIWTVIPTFILVALGVFSANTWARIKNAYSPVYPESFQTEIRIVAQQFNWNVTYPGVDGKFDTPDDIKKLALLNVPYEPEGTEENVLIKLTSMDVIHSFHCPVLRVKQDAVPGYIGNMWFDVRRATDPGPDRKHLTFDVEYSADGRTKTGWEEYYEVACAELCGLGHSDMRMELRAVPRADWERWIAEESRKALEAAQGASGE